MSASTTASPFNGRHVQLFDESDDDGDRRDGERLVHTSNYSNNNNGGAHQSSNEGPTQEDEMGHYHHGGNTAPSFTSRLTSWFSSIGNHGNNTPRAEPEIAPVVTNTLNAMSIPMTMEGGFNSNVTNIRRRLIIFILVSFMVFLIMTILIVLLVPLGMVSNSSSEDSDSDSSSSSSTSAFAYILTIPNAVILGCIMCCCSWIILKKLFTYYMNHSTSPLAHSIKGFLLRHRLLQYEDGGDEDDNNWDIEEWAQHRRQLALQLLQSRGVDINALRLMMEDRDFDANDYETLLQLDGAAHAQPTGLSESALSRLPVFKIPDLTVPIVENSNEDSELYGGDEIQLNNHTAPSRHTARNPSDTSIAFCSETLGRELLNETCCICLSKYECGEVVCTLPSCLHRYHRDCIHQALKVRNQCPICKTCI